MAKKEINQEEVIVEEQNVEEQAEADILIKELGQKAEYTLTNNGTRKETS